MKQLMSITVKRTPLTYTNGSVLQGADRFLFWGDAEHLPYWRNGGHNIDVIIVTDLPDWVVSSGLHRPYVFIRDVLSLTNPFWQFGGSDRADAFRRV